MDDLISRKALLWERGVPLLMPTNIVMPERTWCPSGSYSNKHGEKHRGNHSVHPEISAESKMIAFQCMIDAAKQELPLTLEDLRGMDGEWVWAISSDPDLTVSAWAYIVASQAHTLWEYKPDRLLGNVQLDFENYGKTWLAYRSKPKEENT